ncbi:MAG: hypothetical protein ACJ735_05425 [Actinomycetes bacterium]
MISRIVKANPLADPLRPGGGTVFGVVVGLLIGVLVAVIAIPRHSPVKVLSGPGGIAGPNGTAAGAAGTGAASGAAGPGAAGTSGVAGPGGSAAAGAAGGSSSGVGGYGTTNVASGGGTSGLPRGVTSNTIRLGVAYPDLSALKALGPSYNNGNVPAQWQALIAGWRHRHVLPIGGRDIQLYFATYNVVSADAQNAACRKLIEDDRVFAVIGVEYFQTGSDCVARQFHTPLITNDGPSDASLRGGAPYLYALNMTTGRDLRNWIYWAQARHFLDKARIGVYYSTADPISVYDAQTNVIGLLAHLGHPVAATATTTHTLGGPEDGIAVQKFESKRVNLALLLTSKGGFLDQAQAVNYKPQFIESDYLFGTSDTTTSNYPADEWDGAYAITATTEGAIAGGKPAGPGTTACIKNYETESHDSVSPATSNGHESAEYGYILAGCDEGDVLLAGLRAAGRELTVSRFLSGIKAIHGQHMRRVLTADFRNRDDAADTQRTLVWRKDCTCWRAISDPAPLYTS